MPLMTEKEASERAIRALQIANEENNFIGSWEHNRITQAILEAATHEREDAASYLERCATELLTSKDNASEMQEVMNIELAKILAICAKNIRGG